MSTEKKVPGPGEMVAHVPGCSFLNDIPNVIEAEATCSDCREIVAACMIKSGGTVCWRCADEWARRLHHADLRGELLQDGKPYPSRAERGHRFAPSV